MNAAPPTPQRLVLVTPPTSANEGASAPAPDGDQTSPPDAAPADAPEDDAAPAAGELVPWLQPEIGSEQEVSRTVPATTISWAGPVTIARRPFLAPPGGGVYIVLGSNERPLYVGATTSFRKRWNGRLLSAFQLGLTAANGQLPQPIKVYFGRLPPAHAVQDTLCKAVEHVVVRALINGQLVGPRELRNARSILTLRVKDGVSITDVLPRALLAKAHPIPGLTGNALVLRDNFRFETG